MKVELEIRTRKTFEIDSSIYEEVKGLEGKAALNKIVELLAENKGECNADLWDDSDKLELLEEESSTVTWTHDIEGVRYEQRYRVYDITNYKTLFRGNHDECSQYLADNDFAGIDVDIIEA